MSTCTHRSDCHGLCSRVSPYLGLALSEANKYFPGELRCGPLCRQHLIFLSRVGPQKGSPQG